jgi:protoheme IX farnesyltransferase
LFKKQYLKDILSLSKVMISISVTYTAFAGYVIARNYLDYRIIPVLLGVFILSSGASAINQIVERKTDALMERTKNRPIPSGRISPKHAFAFALICSISGVLLLYLFGGLIVAALGLFNLIWYDFVYTPLKRTTVWAVFIGTITGVVPLYMGYFSSLQEFPSPLANFMAIFLLVWQIPHFLLLLGIYGKEYETAGLATITKKTDISNLFRMSVVWQISSCMIALLFPLFRLNNFQLTSFSIIGISLIVLLINIISLFSKLNGRFKFLFILSNVMQLLIISSLVADNML